MSGMPSGPCLFSSLLAFGLLVTFQTLKELGRSMFRTRLRWFPLSPAKPHDCFMHIFLRLCKDGLSDALIQAEIFLEGLEECQNCVTAT